MTLAGMLTRTAQSDALINGTVIPYLGCFADNDSAAVVDKHALADLGGRMYLYPRNGAVELAYRTGGKLFAFFMKLVSDAVP